MVLAHLTGTLQEHPEPPALSTPVMQRLPHLAAEAARFAQLLRASVFPARRLKMMTHGRDPSSEQGGHPSALAASWPKLDDRPQDAVGRR